MSPVGAGLRVERVGDGGTGLLLALDRPAARNAIDDALLGALLAAIDGLDAAVASGADATDAAPGAPSAPRFVVVTGAGGVFSAGMDLKERAGFDDAALRAQRAAIVRLMTGLADLAVPAIAAVEGPCLAGGFELALACDLIVASVTAVFGLPEVGVGIFPGGGSTHTLPRLVGPARARDLMLTGRRLSAEEAEAWGIAARVVPAGEALVAAVALGETIARGAPIGVREARASIRATHATLREAMAADDPRYERVLVSDDRREGFRAFVEKRPPRFTGR
jgi:enoyl-CoA hydratase/carnithine racemase